MARVRVGVRFDPALGGEDPRRDARRLRAVVEAAARAEAEGLDLAWVGEEAPGPAAPPGAAALPLLAAVAARTRTLRVATAVLPAPIHALRLAEDAATLDGISGGRLELGLGLGGRAAPAQAGSAGLDALVAGLREAFGGAAGGASPRVSPPPVQAGGPPLWLGARSAAGQRRAARLAMGVLLEGEADPGEAYLAAWRELGPPGDGPRLGFLLAPGADAPRRAAEALAAGAARVDLVACADGDPEAALAAAAAWRRAVHADAVRGGAPARDQPPARTRR